MWKTLIGVAALATGGLACADTPDFRFSGFGTLDAVKTNTDEVQFRANYRQQKGADRTVDFGVDSRLGLQANVKFNDTFSAVGQLLTQRRDGKDSPSVEWLYGQANVLSGLDLRIGRMVLPLFLVSDSRAVGYSTVWLREPAQVYSTYPSSSFDGGQALYRYDLAGYNIELQGSLGQARNEFFIEPLPEFKWKINRLSALSATVSHDDWTLRIGQTLSRNLNAIVKSPYIETARNRRDAFTEVGVQYDNGRILGTSEYVIRRQNQGGGFDSNAYYLTGGARFGAWTPYAIYAHMQFKGAQYFGAPNQDTKSLGLRWDFYKNVALKAQFDHTFSPTSLIKPTPSFAANPYGINVMSVAVDFVF